MNIALETCIFLLLFISDKLVRNNSSQYKSVRIKYGDPVCASEAIYLGENKIRWESSVCHLGNYFDTKLSDMIEIKMKCSSFIGSVIISATLLPLMYISSPIQKWWNCILYVK